MLVRTVPMVWWSHRFRCGISKPRGGRPTKWDRRHGLSHLRFVTV